MHLLACCLALAILAKALGLLNSDLATRATLLQLNLQWQRVWEEGRHETGHRCRGDLRQTSVTGYSQAKSNSKAESNPSQEDSWQSPPGKRWGGDWRWQCQGSKVGLLDDLKCFQRYSNASWLSDCLPWALLLACLCALSHTHTHTQTGTHARTHKCMHIVPSARADKLHGTLRGS